MITLEAVAARRVPLTLASVSLAWGSGVHAIVGAQADGGPLLLALVAGRERVRAGQVRVLEADPRSVAVRRQIAFVPFEPKLPAGLTVREVLTIASALRGEPAADPAGRLAVLGIETLAATRVGKLSPDETRAVALAEAVTSPSVRVIMVEEPLVGVDPRAGARLPEALRERGHSGCAVLIATASLRDAGNLADDHVLLRGGNVVGRAASLDELTAFSPDGVRLRIVASDPHALLVALAREEAVVAVARRDATVLARGRDPLVLAAAVARAVASSGVDVTEMRMEAPSMEEARAASAGVAAATYEAAFTRTRAGLSPPPSPQAIAEPASAPPAQPFSPRAGPL